MLPSARDPRRLLAISLDLVVRNSRAGRAQLPDLATRALHAWRVIQHLNIEIQPRHLVIDREPCLEVGQLAGRWLLPTFMAGVRSIGLRKNTTVADLLALGAELSLLRANAASIAAFHGWAWNEARDAFDLDVTLSFTEAIEGIAGEVGRLSAGEAPPAGMARGVRGLMAESLAADALDTGVAELDAAAVMEELDRPIEVFLSAHASRAYEVLPKEFVRLSASCDDGSDWAYLEIRLILRYPRLQEAITPERVAAQVYGRLSMEADPRFLALLHELFELDDAYARAVQTHLDASPLGTLLGNGTPTDNEGRGHVVAFLRREGSPRLRRDLARTILDRALVEPHSRTWVLACVTEVSVSELAPILSMGMLSGPALALLHAGCSSEADFEAYFAALAILGDQTFLDLLPLLPSEAIPRTAGRLEAIIAARRVDHVSAAIGFLLRVDDPACLGVLSSVAQGRLEVSEPRLLNLICAYILRGGLGRTVLLPIARGASYDAGLRLAAIGQLGLDPELGPEAVRFRWSMFLDPAIVRKRIRELRNALRTEPT